MSEQYEFEGKSVDEAVESGLSELGLSREQVTIEVVRKGSRGILGFGGETALVRMQTGASAAAGTSHVAVEAETQSAVHASSDASLVDSAAVDSAAADNKAVDNSASTAAATIEEGENSEADEASDAAEEEQLTSMAIDFLEEIVYLMGYDAEVNAVWKEPEPDETEPCLMLSVDGDDLGLLIGRRGETLDSLQYLLRLMINQRVRNWRNIVVDVANYKSKRSDQIVQLAERMAGQVIESGRAISLEPMPANERRMVHLALRDHPDVYTESSGDSDRRKVHIMPKSLLE